MRSLIILVSAALAWTAVQAADASTAEVEGQNKTKRGVADHYYGDPGTLRFVYQDPAGSAATHPAQPSATYYNNNPRPLVLHAPGAQAKPESEHSKQVAVQQVLYEYQQTPHNAVSNVHVNHHFQAAPPAALPEQRSETGLASTSFPAQLVSQPNVLNVEPNQYTGVIAPIQHGAVIHHGQGYSKLLYNSVAVPPSTPAPQQKLIYANGKILYQPLAVNNQNSPYAGVSVPARPHNLITSFNYQQKQPVVTQKPFKPSPLIPFSFTGLQTLQPQVTPKPTEAPVKEEVKENDEVEEKSNVREDEEEEEDHAGYEEDEEEDYRPSFHSKYRYYDDDDEHESYRDYEDDDDEDNTRSYSKRIRKNPKKYSKLWSNPAGRYSMNDRYKYKEGYKNSKKYNTGYKSPRDHHSKQDSSSKKPKSHYKAYKYVKSSSNSKPKKESIEGHQSQNVPVIHNKKMVLQEKWLITKKESEE